MIYMLILNVLLAIGGKVTTTEFIVFCFMLAVVVFVIIYGLLKW